MRDGSGTAMTGVKAETSNNLDPYWGNHGCPWGLTSDSLKEPNMALLNSLRGLWRTKPSPKLPARRRPIRRGYPLAVELLEDRLVPAAPEAASNVHELAVALHESPVEMYQYVVNNFTNQLYLGLLKGAQATLET